MIKSNLKLINKIIKKRIANDGSLYYTHVAKEFIYMKYTPEVNWKLQLRQIVNRSFSFYFYFLNNNLNEINIKINSKININLNN